MRVEHFVSAGAGMQEGVIIMTIDGVELIIDILV